MKIISLFATLLLITAFIAFSKEKDDIPDLFVIDGLWEGKIGNESGTPSGQYALNIKSDGTVERVSSGNTITAYGTWQLKEGTFTTTYTYSNGTIVNVTGIVDKEKNNLTATWENNGNEEGSLFAYK